jgi:hypothetical protein
MTPKNIENPRCFEMLALKSHPTNGPTLPPVGLYNLHQLQALEDSAIVYSQQPISSSFIQPKSSKIGSLNLGEPWFLEEAVPNIGNKP